MRSGSTSALSSSSTAGAVVAGVIFGATGVCCSLTVALGKAFASAMPCSFVVSFLGVNGFCGGCETEPGLIGIGAADFTGRVGFGGAAGLGAVAAAGASLAGASAAAAGGVAGAAGGLGGVGGFGGPPAAGGAGALGGAGGAGGAGGFGGPPAAGAGGAGGLGTDAAAAGGVSGAGGLGAPPARGGVGGAGGLGAAGAGAAGAATGAATGAAAAGAEGATGGLGAPGGGTAGFSPASGSFGGVGAFGGVGRPDAGGSGGLGADVAAGVDGAAAGVTAAFGGIGAFGRLIFIVVRASSLSMFAGRLSEASIRIVSPRFPSWGGREMRMVSFFTSPIRTVCFFRPRGGLGRGMRTVSLLPSLPAATLLDVPGGRVIRTVAFFAGSGDGRGVSSDIIKKYKDVRSISPMKRCVNAPVPAFHDVFYVFRSCP